MMGGRTIHLKILRALIGAAVIGVPATAFAAGPQTIDDCEKIDEAFAYNACLAKFGPRAGGVRHGNGGGADVPRGPPPKQAAVRRNGATPLRPKGALTLRQTKDGRVIAEFNIGPGRITTQRKAKGI